MKRLRRKPREAYAFLALLAFIFSISKSARTEGHLWSRPIDKHVSIREAFFVVTLQDVKGARVHNAKRLDSFLAHFEDLCGENAIELAPVRGTLDERRGFGLTLAFVAALEHALSINAEFVYVFEDDVRLTNPLFCDAAFRETIWNEVPSDEFAIILAAHHTQEGGLIETSNFGYVELQRHWGSYAWAVRNGNIKSLLDYWKITLHERRMTSLSPDLDLSSRMFQSKYSLLLRSPALFTHPSGFSNTWNKERVAVDDIEKPSLLLSHCSVNDVAAIKRYMSWSDIFHMVVAVHAQDARLQGEGHLLNIKSQRLRLVGNAAITALVQNISSSVIFHSRCNARIQKKDLMRIWKMHLYYPFDIIRLHDGRLSHECVDRLQVDVDSMDTVYSEGLILAQKRFYRLLHTDEITSDEERVLVEASSLMRFHSAKMTKDYSMKACGNTLFD